MDIHWDTTEVETVLRTLNESSLNTKRVNTEDRKEEHRWRKCRRYKRSWAEEECLRTRADALFLGLWVSLSPKIWDTHTSRTGWRHWCECSTGCAIRWTPSLPDTPLMCPYLLTYRLTQHDYWCCWFSNIHNMSLTCKMLMQHIHRWSMIWNIFSLSIEKIETRWTFSCCRAWC